MSWYREAVFYEIYVRAFADGDGDGQGDLRGLVERLDYLQWLGVDCLWLLPIMPSPLVDDGYDVADFHDVHPDYGTLADFDRLLSAAHDRGLRVITDLVVNHTSDQHPWFQESRSDRDNPYRDWYVWRRDPQAFADARIIFVDTEESNWAFDPQSWSYYWHRFFRQQPDLNYDNPAVQAAMLEVVDFWLARGVDGFRVDAVPYLFQREGTSCENLPETHAFLRRLRAHVDARFEDRLLLAEANQGPEAVVEYFGEGDAFHMAFHFPVMPRLFQALAQGDADPIRAVLARTPEIPGGCQWCTFLRNHDELTLEMVSPEERATMWRHYAPEPRMRSNLGIRRRLSPLLGGDRRRIELLHSLLLTLPGAPVLYYGDEIGMGDDIWRPDRHGVRTPMQWTAGPNGGFSAAPPGALYARPIDDPRYGPGRVNVLAARADPKSLLHFVRDRLAERRRHPALLRGTCQLLPTERPEVLAHLRACDEERLLLLHNLSDRPIAGIQPELGPFELPPYGFRWVPLG